tara:strand:- start:513 stop:839 length:327 start_codon:yes stop_codon:yes gene_type:complete
MDIDIKIYVKKLKDFFNRDKDARADVFGETNVDMNQFYRMVTKQAILNHKERGDPTLSPIELMEIMADLALIDVTSELDIEQTLHLHNRNIDNLFSKPLKDFPPFCLN